jgi:hypothetical protein
MGDEKTFISLPSSFIVFSSSSHFPLISQYDTVSRVGGCRTSRSIRRQISEPVSHLTPEHSLFRGIRSILRLNPNDLPPPWKNAKRLAYIPPDQRAVGRNANGALTRSAMRAIMEGTFSSRITYARSYLTTCGPLRLTLPARRILSLRRWFNHRVHDGSQWLFASFHDADLW